MTMIGGNPQDLTATLRGGELTTSDESFQSGYMQVSNCQGSHRYFVAETFAVEGEGIVGAIIICTACGESKVISHKVARAGSSVSLKENKRST